MNRRTRLTGQDLAVLRLMVAGRGEGAVASELEREPPAVRRALLEVVAKVQGDESGGG